MKMNEQTDTVCQTDILRCSRKQYLARLRDTSLIYVVKLSMEW